MAENDFSKMLQSGAAVIDITVEAAKMTSDVLKAALSEFLEGNNTQKTGKLSMKQLKSNAHGGKLDSIEITENNIKDFLGVAAKYDVNYSLFREKGESADSPNKYHVVFQTSQAENFKRAFSEYAHKKQGQIAAQKAPYNRAKLKEDINRVAQQPKIHKEREKTKEVSR